MRFTQFVTVAGTIAGVLAFAPETHALRAQTATLTGSPPRIATALPYPLASSVVLHAPGTSRFAGEYRGSESVAAALDALCATSVVSGAQAFVATAESVSVGASEERASDSRLTNAVGNVMSGSLDLATELSSDPQLGAFVLLRTAREGHHRLAWHEVLVFRLDSRKQIQSIELYVEDQRAWDRRFPREDGVSQVSVATERNVVAARGRVREARFVAGNADRVVAVIDAPRELGHTAGVQQTVLVQETIAPSGAVRERTRFVSVPMMVGTRE